MFLLSRWAGGLVERYGAKKPLMIGPAIAAIGFALFAIPGIGGSYWITFFPAVLILGLGMAITVAPLTTTVMSALDTGLAGIASGINNAVARVAALLAIAVLGLIMSIAFNHTLKQQVVKSGVSPAISQQIISQQLKLAAIELPSEITQTETEALQHAVASSFVYGFRWVMLVSALLALSSALGAWLMIADRKEQAN